MPPVNDTMATATALAISGSLVFSNVDATTEDDGWTQDLAMWWKWTAPADCILEVRTSDTRLPRWDSVIDVFVALDPADVDTWVWLAGDDDSDPQPGLDWGTDRVRFKAVVGETYYIAISAYEDDGAEARSDAVLTWIAYELGQSDWITPDPETGPIEFRGQHWFNQLEATAHDALYLEETPTDIGTSSIHIESATSTTYSLEHGGTAVDSRSIDLDPVTDEGTAPDDWFDVEYAADEGTPLSVVVGGWLIGGATTEGGGSDWRTDHDRLLVQRLLAAELYRAVDGSLRITYPNPDRLAAGSTVFRGNVVAWGGDSDFTYYAVEVPWEDLDVIDTEYPAPRNRVLGLAGTTERALNALMPPATTGNAMLNGTVTIQPYITYQPPDYRWVTMGAPLTGTPTSHVRQRQVAR